MCTFKFIGLVIAHGHTALYFYPPTAVFNPPGITAEETQAPEIALQPIVPHLGIQAEGEGDLAHIEMGIDDVGSYKSAFEHLVLVFVEVEAQFRSHHEIPPVDGIVHIPVPGQPTGPALETHVATQGEMPAKLELHTQVGFGQAVPQQVRAHGNILRFGFIA